MYQALTEYEFRRLIFTSADRLGIEYIEEAKKQRQVVIRFMRNVLLRESFYRLKDTRSWGVVHATHILGILADPTAYDALISASKFSNLHRIQWIWAALPECYLRLGKGMIPKLMLHIEALKSSDHDYVNEEIMGLWNFWQVYPEERQRIETFLMKSLLDAETDPPTKTDLILDFAQIGRKDLKPISKLLYENVEVDSHAYPWEEVEKLYDRPHAFRAYRYDLEEFYSAEEIDAREEDDDRLFRHMIEANILEDFHNIPIESHCPCCSGKKFKRCHFLWAEREIALEKDEAELEEELQRIGSAIQRENKLEADLRKVLGEKGQSALFPKLKSKVQEAVNAPVDEFTSKGFFSYLETVFSKIEFKDKKETEGFMSVLVEYSYALSQQLPGYSKRGRAFHLP